MQSGYAARGVASASDSGAGPQTYAQKRGACSTRLPWEITIPSGSITTLDSTCFLLIYSSSSRIGSPERSGTVPHIAGGEPARDVKLSHCTDTTCAKIKIRRVAGCVVSKRVVARYRVDMLRDFLVGDESSRFRSPFHRHPPTRVARHELVENGPASAPNRSLDHVDPTVRGRILQ